MQETVKQQLAAEQVAQVQYVAPKINAFSAAAANSSAANQAADETICLDLSAFHERNLAVKTPSPKEHKQTQQNDASARVSVKSRFTCCIRPAVSNDEESTTDSISPLPAHQHKRSTHIRSIWHEAFSPKLAQRSQTLSTDGSAAYSDAEWFDARSQVTSVLGGMPSDHAAKIEELSAMLKDMHADHAAHLSTRPNVGPAGLGPGGKCPWVPETALAFGEPGMQFMPVGAHTGFAAYWERIAHRSSPYPTPIDVMIKASALAMRSHASIPGIWLQETDRSFTVTVKPRFLPAGLPRYTETYDKTNATEPCWPMRRDLRLGTTSGQIFMTTDGMLILRARSRPIFGSCHDFIMEEYMRLEDGSQTIVDRMCCLCVKSGLRATQYVVGRRHAVPLKGHV